jgi:hypothetical protein
MQGNYAAIAQLLHSDCKTIAQRLLRSDVQRVHIDCTTIAQRLRSDRAALVQRLSSDYEFNIATAQRLRRDQEAIVQRLRSDYALIAQ